MELDDDTFESGGRDILGQFILVHSTTDIQHPIIFDTYALNIFEQVKTKLHTNKQFVLEYPDLWHYEHDNG